MPQRKLGTDVFEETIDRIYWLYKQGHKVVVSFSGGKDSGAMLELTKLAAEKAGELPVEVVMRDEEIMFPGTFEYAERVYDDPDVNLNWLIAGQPVVNAFSREKPFFWVFDQLLEPEEWVRQPPEYAEWIPDLFIEKLVTPERFPPKPGGDVVVLIGVRVDESLSRRMSVASAGGFLTQKNKWGYRKAKPMYDWKEGDIWKAHHDYGWDYNKAYDKMFQMGVPAHKRRIAPPTLIPAGIDNLGFALKAWPKWFARVERRLPGLRTAAQFGRRAVEPIRRSDETWEECFHRTCIDEAPDWIAERATKARDLIVARHARHSSSPFPQVKDCIRCGYFSWRRLAKSLYMGDPFSLLFKQLPEVEPEYFRPGAGTWEGGTPSFG